jgi:hypothetical protein
VTENLNLSHKEARMSEEVSYIPEPPESFEAVPEKKKNNTTLWIILAVAAVIIICCCLVITLFLVFGYIVVSDQFFSEILPYLQLV